MTRFLHITDLHITVPETHTQASFARLAEAVARLDPQPDFILASGDLTDHGDASSYAWLAERLESLGAPVIMTLGNHDDRAAWHSVFAAHPNAPDGPVDQEATLAGLQIIALDSSVAGKVSGALTDAQLQAAAQKMAAEADLPKLITLHHPPCLRFDPDRVWASLDIDSSRRLAALIADHTVLGVFVGHIHMNRVMQWHGVPVIVSQGLQSSADPVRSEGLLAHEGAGFAICDVIDGTLQVSFAPLHTTDVVEDVSAEVMGAYT